MMLLLLALLLLFINIKYFTPVIYGVLYHLYKCPLPYIKKCHLHLCVSVYNVYDLYF